MEYLGKEDKTTINDILALDTTQKKRKGSFAHDAQAQASAKADPSAGKAKAAPSAAGASAAKKGRKK